MIIFLQARGVVPISHAISETQDDDTCCSGFAVLAEFAASSKLRLNGANQVADARQVGDLGALELDAELLLRRQD